MLSLDVGFVLGVFLLNTVNPQGANSDCEPRCHARISSR